VSGLLFVSGNAMALGLGELVMHSRLGQALRAEIRLIEPSGASHSGETCFRLGASEGSETLPVLTQGRLRLEESGGQRRLVVTSLQTINEPALLLHVHVGCGAELVRSYTLLMDPPEAGAPATDHADTPVGSDAAVDRREAVRRPAASSQPVTDAYPTIWDAVEGESGKSITKALFPRQPRAQRRFLNALRAANPQVDLGADGETPLAAGVSLVIPDTRRAAATREAPETPAETPAPRKAKKPVAPAKPALDGKISDRLMISGDAVLAPEATGLGDTSELGLRLSSDLSMRLSDKVSENARAMLRVEYRLMNALVFQAEKQLELAEQIRNLEASFEAMRAANEAAVKTADDITAVNKAERGDEAELPAEKKPGHVTVPKTTVAPAKVPATGVAGWWQPILLMLLLAGALAWWLARHRRAGRAAAEMAREDVAEATADTAALKANSLFKTAGRAAPVDPWEAAEAEAGPVAPLDIVLDASQPLPFSAEERTTAAHPALAIEVSHVEEADDSSTVLELAEIMISFGRIKGAAQALAEYLENNPESSLFPWLKLLEVYRMNDMREEFAACSTRLRSYFNVAPASWEEAGACLGEKIEPLNENDLSIESLLEKLPTVATFPHIREGILKTWDTSEGPTYLKHLLRDTRNGQRTGFPLSIARELLFLLDLQDTRLRSKA